MASESQDRNADMNADPVSEELLDDRRMSRRIALRAAAAGGAGAAAFFAPKFKDGAFVPDYAAAASCAPSGPNSQTFNSDAQFCPGSKFCWGTASDGGPGNSDCICSDETFGPLELDDGNFSVSGTYGGASDSVGSVNFDVTGIDPPFQSCTVAVDASCENPNQTSPTQSEEFSSDGSGSFDLPNCPSSSAGQFTLTLSCICS